MNPAARPPSRPGRLNRPLPKPVRAGAPAEGREGCAIERSKGCPAFGAVLVAGGGVKLREPRLPELEPPPARALASAATRTSALAMASSARNGRRRRKRIIESSQRAQGHFLYRYHIILWE